MRHSITRGARTDPVTRREIALPPSVSLPHLRGNDTNRAGLQSAANEVVNLALGLKKTAQQISQDVLNPEGINCFRFFGDAGSALGRAHDQFRSGMEVRKPAALLAYLEHSIDKGRQWARV